MTDAATNYAAAIEAHNAAVIARDAGFAAFRAGGAFPAAEVAAEKAALVAFDAAFDAMANEPEVGAVEESHQLSLFA